MTISEISDWRNRDTVTIPQAGKILGISRNSAYEAAKNDELPVIWFGKRGIVSVPGLKKLLDR